MTNFTSTLWRPFRRAQAPHEKPGANGVANDNGMMNGNGYSYDGHPNTPLPWITWRLFALGILISMGGMIL
jgi:hypothetical protein